MSTLLKILSATIIIATPALAAYAPQEMCVIPWGDSAGQLRLNKYYMDYDYPADDTGVIEPQLEWDGPTDKFIDKYENIYVSSSNLHYFKIFDNHGILISDLSKGSNKYDTTLYTDEIDAFCVDSLMRIYIHSYPAKPYINVIDTSGRLTDRLYPPCGEDSLYPGQEPYTPDELPVWFRYGTNDVLIFICQWNGMFTYKNGEYLIGGADHFLGINGNYHWIEIIDSTIIRFKTGINPDLMGKFERVSENEVSYDGHLTYTGMAGLDDSLNIYISYYDPILLNGGILIYNSSYELVGRIILKPCFNEYGICMGEFYRQDGNIYEFRCLDDGLHVIRWSRK